MQESKPIYSYANLSQQPHRKAMSSPGRFVSVESRKIDCDIPRDVWMLLLEGSYKQHWKDIHIQKTVMEMVLYPMLLQELKPRTIIEIGAFNGGSAVWLADHVTMLGIPCDIYSIDIDLSFLDDRAKADQRISFLQGDSNNIEAVLSPDLLAKLPHPWLIFEDAHVNLVGIINHFYQNGMKDGDYLIIEGTNLFCWDCWNSNFLEEENGDLKENRGAALRQFLLEHPGEFLVDTYYQDIFGYNATKSWNSILIKT